MDSAVKATCLMIFRQQSDRVICLEKLSKVLSMMRHLETKHPIKRDNWHNSNF